MLDALFCVLIFALGGYCGIYVYERGFFHGTGVLGDYKDGQRSVLNKIMGVPEDEEEPLVGEDDPPLRTLQ